MKYKHKIRTVVQIGGKTYTSPTGAATALTDHCSQALAQPKYNDAVPRSSWNCALYWRNVRRIEKRAYPRFLKVCKVLLK